MGAADLSPGPQRARQPGLRRRVRVRASTRVERYVDEHGRPRQRIRRLPQADWEVLIWEHHPGFIDWPTFEANQERIAGNTRPRAHEPGGAVREGQALLQGIAVLRPLRTPAQGPLQRSAQPSAAPPITVAARIVVEDRGSWCLRVGGAPDRRGRRRSAARRADPGGRQGRAAGGRSAGGRPRRRRLSSGGCRSNAPAMTRDRAERRYRQVEPEHRLVARGLERDWEHALAALATAEAELALREQQRPRSLTDAERERLLATRRGPRSRLVGADDHRPRPQATAALPDRGSDSSTPARTSAAPRSRSAGTAARSPNSPSTLPQATANDPHRRGHDRTARTARRPLRRRARSPGSSTAKAAAPPPASGSPRIIVGGAAPLPQHPRIPSRPTEPADGELLPVGKAADELGVAPPRSSAGSKPDSSPANRTHPAPHGGSASTTTSAPCSSRTRPPGYAADRRRHATPRRLPPNGVAACQARRTQRPPRPQRTPKRPANTGPNTRKHPLRHHPHERVGSVTMAPRSPGCRPRTRTGTQR